MATSRSKTARRRAAPKSLSIFSRRISRRTITDLLAIASVLAMAVTGYLYDPEGQPAKAMPRNVPAVVPKADRDLAGMPSVIDGDTLEIHGTRVRLFAVDAPESRQICQDDEGADWRCGQKAAQALAGRIGRSAVTCDARDTDRYGRIVATCRVGGEDLGRWLVRQGLAMAYREYGTDYVADEIAAKSQARGIWGGSFQYPWMWRKTHS